MKTGKGYLCYREGFTPGLSLNAFAKDKNETRITLSDSAQVVLD